MLENDSFIAFLYFIQSFIFPNHHQDLHLPNLHFLLHKIFSLWYQCWLVSCQYTVMIFKYDMLKLIYHTYLMYGNTTWLLADSSFWLKPRRKVDFGVAFDCTMSWVITATDWNSFILLSSHSELMLYSSSCQYWF